MSTPFLPDRGALPIWQRSLLILALSVVVSQWEYRSSLSTGVRPSAENGEVLYAGVDPAYCSNAICWRAIAGAGGEATRGMTSWKLSRQRLLDAFRH